MIEWYYRDAQSQKVGPLTAAEFDVCVTVGEVQPETEVWRTDLADWTTYAAILAEQTDPEVASKSRCSRHAPLTTSYRTFIALGASRTHQSPAKARVITSGCTPYGVPEPCFMAAEMNAELETLVHPILDRSAVDAVWLGRQFVRISLVGMAFVLGHFLFAGKTGPTAPVAKPVCEMPRVVLGPLDTSTASVMASLNATAEPAN